MSFPTVRTGRRVGLSRNSKSTPSSNALSLEDETQQPPVAGSSQAAAATSSAAIFHQLHQQYASSGPPEPSAGPTPRIAPLSSDPPHVAPSSDLTQPESDGSIAWESNQSNPAPLPSHGSHHRTSLGQIEEEPHPQPVSQPPPSTSQPPPTGSAMSSDLTDKVSQTPEFINGSQRDDIDSAESEMSDIEEDGDASSVSTPSNSDPEAASAPAPRTSMRSPAPPLRPITQSVREVTTPTRPLISPSRHARTFTTPTKNTKQPLFSPTQKLTAPPLLTLSKPGSPSKSVRLPPPPPSTLTPTFSRTRSAPERSPSPGESSNFGDDMLPNRALKPRERFDATIRAASALAPCWETTPPDGESAGSAGEPTYLNEDEDFNGKEEVIQKDEVSNKEEEEEDELDDRDPEEGTDAHRRPAHASAEGSNSSSRQFHSSETQVDLVNSGSTSTPTRQLAAGIALVTRTRPNTVAPEGSQTQLNSDNPPPSSPFQRGHFASLDARSAVAPSSPGLWGESIGEDEIGGPGPMSSPHETFVPTQVKSLPRSTSSPFKQSLPPFPQSSPKARDRERRENAGSAQVTSSSGGGRYAPPSDAELEPTFVEAASHASAALPDAVQAPSSDPPSPSFFPSRIERTRPTEREVANAPVISTPPSPPPADERMLDVREEVTTPTRKRPLSLDSSEETLFQAPRPRTSPNKYGKRHNRYSHIPSTRGGMPHKPPPSDHGSATEKAPSPEGERLGASQAESSHALQDESPRSSAHPPSASSSSVPDDPEDGTFPDVGAKEPSSGTEPRDVEPLSIEPPSPVVRRKSTSARQRKAPVGTRERATTRASSRPARDKRKARSSSPVFSDSSSSAAEDEDDFSYRPTELGRVKAKAAAATERVRKASSSSRDATPDEPPKGKGKRAAATPPRPERPKRAKRATTSAATPPPPKSSKPRQKATMTAASRVSRSEVSSSRAKGASVTTAAASRLVPLRVLAQWHKSDYYAGTVTSRNASGYHVDFDDGHDVWVGHEQLRLLELRPGEPVCERTPGNIYHVAEQYEGLGDVQVVDAHSKVHRIPVKHLLVLSLEIVRRFPDRHVPRDELDERFPDSVNVFAGKVFIVTSSEEKEKDAVVKKIQQNGGVVTQNWTDIFDITDESHKINTQDAPFLVSLGSKRVVSSKLMSSLASGVPVLSPRYVEDSIKGPVDWRAYLISPGESALLREPAVQVVDPAWGSASWNAAEARAARQPLAGISVLWIPAGARWRGHDEINTLVPFCLCAMGALMTVAASLPADLATVEQELVAVEDRDGRKLTKQQRTSGKLVNVGWLKAVLMAGARLPPSIIRN